MGQQEVTVTKICCIIIVLLQPGFVKDNDVSSNYPNELTQVPISPSEIYNDATNKSATVGV